MNNKKIKLSIIIPVYNVAPYLEECITSCIKQKSNAVEFIFIDDYSTDNSLEILQRFIKIEPRMQIIVHKKNKGLSAARNTGLHHANGDYIWFIDSDDYIDNTAIYKILSTLYPQQQKWGGVFDCIIINYAQFDHLTKKITFYSDYYEKKLNLQYEIEKYSLSKAPISTCFKIIKKEILLQYNFLFLEGTQAEDIPTFIYFYYIKSLITIPDYLYYYRTRPYSITATNSIKMNYGVIVNTVQLYNKIESITNQKDDFIRATKYKFAINTVNHKHINDFWNQASLYQKIKTLNKIICILSYLNLKDYITYDIFNKRYIFIIYIIIKYYPNLIAPPIVFFFLTNWKVTIKNILYSPFRLIKKILKKILNFGKKYEKNSNSNRWN